ncbi:hypothetical protein GVN16_03425 [Emticicia sp. CRIBPO]|uniref:hypothetical protein n=1 Tax=Emticicia sp. CRIBPO TaxID=2683258 RepID=UPI001412C012|nr:hypothetical protein [Emticicia sp. CRIBPO]NBA84791.1 hypothetical protein [Emticicia sp. CRIBPO]
MKVDIDPSFQFTPFFENKLKAFLKDEFIKKVGMEVHRLWLQFLDIEVFLEN